MQSQHDVRYRLYMGGDLVCRLLVSSNTSYCGTLRGIMKKTFITLLGLAAVLTMSGCQNGVLATPFGDYGVKSRDGNHVTIGFINKKTPQLAGNAKAQNQTAKPKIVMPKGFQGHWVTTDNSKNSAKACKDDYLSDDAVNLNIDANNNYMSLTFYEEGGDAHWLNMQQISETQVAGTVSYLFQGQGDENPQPEAIAVRMTLKNGGKQLAVHNWDEENKTSLYVLCSRTPQIYQ